jgi:hypothetical protein
MWATSAGFQVVAENDEGRTTARGSVPARWRSDEGRCAGGGGSGRRAGMERRNSDERSLRLYTGVRLKGGFGEQGHTRVEPRPVDDQALVVERCRMDLLMLISLAVGGTRFLVSMLEPLGVRLLVPTLVRMGVEQRNACRDEVRDEREHHEECTSTPPPASGGAAHVGKLHRRPTRCQFGWCHGYTDPLSLCGFSTEVCRRVREAGRCEPQGPPPCFHVGVSIGR